MVGTAIAAIGGLWAQAVATYWSQQTAKDQLNQSREDSDREKRQQAAQVTFWVEETNGTPGKIHIVNRSPDAVTQVVTAVSILKSDGEDPPFLLQDTDLRPCGEAVYSATGLEVSRFGRNGAKPMPRLSDSMWQASRLYFIDRNGTPWVRSLTGLTEGEPPLTPPSGVGRKRANSGILIVKDAPQVK
ncbi:hypothetical protein [Streptomyces sp. NRRL S-646]|uniref:hypothetical protein n=1 Tax=Streptomyces sp. NRRL S-646 TaxID=1463917 RepID=UPI0013315E47|nr:hypothetical protein [Streptomyces sp. NRRL S-646]